jgi:hypothetical protein
MSENVLTITGALSRRSSRRNVVRDVAVARRELSHQLFLLRDYKGGLPMEQVSHERRRREVTQETITDVRRSWCRRQGRRIDLAGLLRQQDSVGHPIWPIVDPTSRCGDEGKFDKDGTILIHGVWRRFFADKDVNKPEYAFVPVGIPPLPQPARDLFGNKAIRRRALWVGLLYQPQGWMEVKPDPAVVVEWACLPGEYYALAVWGGDRARIMEFVD